MWKPYTMNSVNDRQATAIPEKISMSQARSELPKLVQSLSETPSKVFEVDKHGMPQALLLSFETYNPIIQALKSGDLVPILATLILNRWLDMETTPAHIYKPQLDELKTMGQAQLLTLLQEEPCDSISKIENIDTLNHSLVERLIKRCKVAHTVAEAQKSGLYEASEHSGE